MNAKIIKSVSADFVLSERLLLFENAEKYTQEILQHFLPNHTYSVFRKCVFVLELNQGQAALFGFLATATLLKHWQEHQKNSGWFTNNLETLENLGSERIQKYFCPFLEILGIGIAEVIRVLGKKSPIVNFITFCEKRWPGFQIGAFLLIGIFLFLDENIEDRTSDAIVFAE